MKECGGGGKQGSIPNETYVPECFSKGEICPMCKCTFSTNDDLKEHAKSFHKDYVSKWWSRDALNNADKFGEYKEWLNQVYENKRNL